MQIVTSFKEVLENKELFDGKYEIYAFFMYTAGDKNLAEFIRKNYKELNRLTGRRCLVFIADNPKYWRKNFVGKRAEEISNYWKNLRKMKGIWQGFLETVPYETGQIYDIADQFGIDHKDIPCIVFFPNLNRSRMIVRKLSEIESSQPGIRYFRSVFSAITKNELRGKSGEEIWAALEKSASRRGSKMKILELAGSIASIISTIITISKL
jgi:hypothetical protein